MDDTRKRTVALPAALDQAVEDAVAAGDYPDAEAAIGEALTEWRERREHWGYTIAELRAEIRKGIDSGPGRLETMDEIKAEARRQFAARNKRSA